MTQLFAKAPPVRTGAKKRPPLAAPGMRVGLLGGSFNPPHRGHRHVALMALKRLGLDRVWCMVSPGNPLKPAAGLAHFEARFAAARRVLRHPRIDVTGFEAALTSAYTIDSLRFLKRRYPNVHFIWIMGGDNLASFHRWRRWRKIFALVSIAVFDRPEWRLKAMAAPAARAAARRRVRESGARRLATSSPPAWTFVSIPLSDESSTRLRSLMQTSVPELSP
jgi:nicotinate-nucleotide adenylyltransferase